MHARVGQGRRRPFGVVLLAGLWIIYGSLAILYLVEREVPVIGIARLFDGLGLRTAVHSALAVLAAISAVGLWFLRSWGWITSMLLAGVNLAVEIALYFLGVPHYGYPYLAVAVVIAFYLNLREVRGRFFAHAEDVPITPLADDERVGA